MNAAPSPALLDVAGLSTSFAGPAGRTRVVDDISFRVAPGTITGIVGESGSGKSVSVKSVLGLVAPPGRVEAGTARFAGTQGEIDLLACPRAELRGVLGTDIGFVIQNPFGALSPVTRIRKQFVTVLRASRRHARTARGELDELAEATLAAVGINDPRRVLEGYPHQLSGGMAQRVVIAFALARRPRLIVADEPTTALDLTVQRQILDLMAERAAELGASVLLITHDLGVVAHYCREAYVFHRGRIVEQGAVADIFHRTRHDYTRRLIAASGGRRDTAGAEAVP
ncbi:MAG: ABC transporter ATP-binding protein [Rhodobacteraceae bacterium]|jgi:ABC-type dipeptide/oligopeptide/nickel transport system ATPase component|nr:ABC transporter ATP-binding protein [Paracoccaceae bacterium]